MKSFWKNASILAKCTALVLFTAFSFSGNTERALLYGVWLLVLINTGKDLE